jgi:hypothetical protein
LIYLFYVTINLSYAKFTVIELISGEWPVWLAKIRKLKVEISMFVVYSLIEEVLVDLDPKDLGKNVVCLLPWGSRNLALSSKQVRRTAAVFLT